MSAITEKENRVVEKRTDSAAATNTAPPSTAAYLSPLVNIFETKDGYVLEADMPGVNKGGLEILLEGNELTIYGRRDTDVSGADLIYRESKPAHFRRVFELDPAIDTQRISAKMENGVLTLTLPKSEEVKPRRITISD